VGRVADAVRAALLPSGANGVAGGYAASCDARVARAAVRDATGRCARGSRRAGRSRRRSRTREGATEEAPGDPVKDHVVGVPARRLLAHPVIGCLSAPSTGLDRAEGRAVPWRLGLADDHRELGIQPRCLFWRGHSRRRRRPTRREEEEPEHGAQAKATRFHEARLIPRPSIDRVAHYGPRVPPAANAI
jgi:hypothetical protein